MRGWTRRKRETWKERERETERGRVRRKRRWKESGRERKRMPCQRCVLAPLTIVDREGHSFVWGHCCVVLCCVVLCYLFGLFYISHSFFFLFCLLRFCGSFCSWKSGNDSVRVTTQKRTQNMNMKQKHSKEVQWECRGERGGFCPLLFFCLLCCVMSGMLFPLVCRACGQTLRQESNTLTQVSQRWEVTNERGRGSDRARGYKNQCKKDERKF